MRRLGDGPPGLELDLGLGDAASGAVDADAFDLPLEGCLDAVATGLNGYGLAWGLIEGFSVDGDARGGGTSMSTWPTLGASSLTFCLALSRMASVTFTSEAATLRNSLKCSRASSSCPVSCSARATL